MIAALKLAGEAAAKVSFFKLPSCFSKIPTAQRQQEQLRTLEVTKKMRGYQKGQACFLMFLVPSCNFRHTRDPGTPQVG